MTTTAEMRLRHIVEQTALKLTDADGRFHKRQLTDAVREQIAREDLDPHVKAAALDKLAQSLVTGFGEQRNPVATAEPAASSTPSTSSSWATASGSG